MRVSVHWNAPARVAVDPNSADRDRPDLSVVLLERFGSTPAEGDGFLAVQPDESGVTEAVAPGVVVEVDSDFGVVFVRVAWDELLEVPTPQVTSVMGGIWQVKSAGQLSAPMSVHGWMVRPATTEPSPWEASVELTPA